MSSMRNAVQRRNHKERSQPAERQKWGILEKKKDYALRARDFNLKKKKLAALRHKAAERNPDEFYFAMTSSRTRDGGIRVAEREDSGAMSQDVVKLLKTQDAGYVRTQSAIERKKIERLEEELAFFDDGKEGGVGGKHTVFVESEEEAREFKPEEFFDTHKDLLERRFNRLRLDQLKDPEIFKLGGANPKGKQTPEEMKATKKAGAIARKKLQKAREGKYNELEVRMKREAELKRAEREMELQRARMGKGGMVKKNKWARVRRR